jgi:alkaline phosphatase D
MKFALCLFGAVTCLLISCSPSYRAGFPPGSPFAEALRPSSDLLPQGVAVGDVSATRALVWLRTEGPSHVQVAFAPVELWDRAQRDESAVTMKSPRFTTSADHDFTVAISLDGLRPATQYRYEVMVASPDADPTFGSEARVGAVGEFATLPETSASVPVTFVWSADIGGLGRCRDEREGYPIFNVILAHQPDLFLLMGDTIYGDHPCPSPPNAPGSDFIATTLEEYRTKHRYQRGSSALRNLLASVPVFVVWDDHEVRNNFAGRFDDQMPAGRQAFREYWPIASPADDPQRLYRTMRYGADVEVFILDTRSYRSRNSDPDGPEKTMLGPAQLAWLLDGLKQSTATWKVIATTVPLSVPKPGTPAAPGSDGWAGGVDGTGFHHELKKIVDAILSNRLKNVIWLAADVHYVQANVYDPDGDGVPDFQEFVAGPLSAVQGRLTPPIDTFKPTNLINEGGYFNFGLVHATKTSFDVTVIDDSGKTRFSYHVPAR